MSRTRAYLTALALMVLALIGIVLATGLPWLMLAVVLGVVATRGWGRSVVGALIAAAGVGAVLAYLVGSIPGSPFLGAASGALLALAGAWTAVAGRTWPAMGARYDAGPPKTRSARALSAWEAQDRGIDPTEEPSD